jgi:hypothetical protein
MGCVLSATDHATIACYKYISRRIPTFISMPPKKGRQEREFSSKFSRLSSFSLIVARLAAAQQALTPEIIAKRTKRHLDELEVHAL